MANPAIKLTRSAGSVRCAAVSDVGMRRASNQDAMAIALAEDEREWRRRGHLFVVADGMGAHAAGELASQLATDNIPHVYIKRQDMSPCESIAAAIQDANGAPGQTITFAPGVTGTITLDSPLPDLNGIIDLQGPGPAALTVQPGSGGFSVFTVGSGATVILAGLTVTHAVAAGASGVVNSGGTLALDNCAVVGNASPRGGVVAH